MNEDRKRKGFANSKLLSAVTISVLFIDIAKSRAGGQGSRAHAVRAP